MIYIFTALYCEAYYFVKELHLKKVSENTHFQQFAGEDLQILLTISGVGEIAAAAAVSSVCTQYPPKENDLLLNVGVCAGTTGRGELFLAHKLVEQITAKTFYPDILYRHRFQESVLMTGMVPWKQKSGKDDSLVHHTETSLGGYLYDMEAAAIYQAGEYFFGPHQMIFLKIISDCGEDDRLTEQTIKQLMERHVDSICDFLNQLIQAAYPGSMVKSRLLSDQKEQMERTLRQLCQDLHCTKTMQDLLRQHIHYAALAGIDYVAVVQEMYAYGQLPCKDKREGKHRFEELKQRLL